MHDTQAPRPRLNILSRAARRKRIFARMREGWAYDEIARDEGLSAERVRQIVAEVLGKRVIERGSNHAHLQLERLMPALRLAGEAIARGDIKAIAQ
jgi:DNA-directed RNA polymerase sigma subunit (sigma70/sigma32)